MRILEIPDTPDDLRYASEAIQRIAEQSIQSIVQLYSLRLKEDSTSSLGDSNYQKIKEDQTNQTAQNALDDRFNLNCNQSKVSTDPRAHQANKSEIRFSVDSRPPLVDNNLHNLNL